MTRPSDLIVLGSTATFGGASGFAWVDGLAVTDGRVVAAGARHEIASTRGARTRILVLEAGQVAIPGLTDAHLHLAGAAVAADELDLEAADSLETALALVADAHATQAQAGDPLGWLLGGGWTADRWGQRPTAADLERVAPGRPVALWAHDHHTRWLSEAGLHALGVDATSADPPGGHIGRDASGRPDGLLFEHASEIEDERIPRPSEAAMRAAIVRYASRLASLGVTGVHDPGGPDSGTSLDGAFAAIRGLARTGELPVRVHVGVFDLQLEAAIAAGLHSGRGLAGDPGVAVEQSTDATARATNLCRFGWLKLFADGTVGSRTAAMLEPYHDAAIGAGPSGPRGVLLESPERLRQLIATAAEAGIATMVHAIGDQAVRTTLDAFEAVGAARLARLALGPRVEHAQLVAADDVPRFGRLGVAASMQPVQLRSDEPAMRRAWGERTHGAFPVASLIRSGALVAFGTDAPVEPPDPWPGIAMAVARWAPEWGSGAGSSAPTEAVGLDVALRAATVGPWLTTRDPVGGRLVVGAPADLVVLPIDLAAGAAPDIEAVRALRPLLTLIDGQERHRAADFDR